MSRTEQWWSGVDLGELYYRLDFIVDFLDLDRNLIFYFIDGPHSTFVQLDVVLTFHFCQGLPRKCLYISLENHPRVGALRAPTLGGL